METQDGTRIYPINLGTEISVVYRSGTLDIKAFNKGVPILVMPT